jgi:tripartite-type tricarboxylate transporter receptor subunit TctC
LAKDASFDLKRDLTPVSLVATTPFVLAVHPGLPVKTVADLITLAKAKDGGLRYANSGRGSNQQMSIELLKSMSGAPITRREYDGGGGALNAVVSGDSDIGIFAQGAIIQQLKDGKLRAIAVTGKARSSGLPDIPTIAESGLPGYEFTSWVGVFAPASTPMDTLAAIGGQVTKAAADPAFVSLMTSRGAVAVGSSPTEFKAFLQSELSLWGDIIAKSGI